MEGSGGMALLEDRGDAWERRILTIALTTSMLGHLALFGAQLRWGGFGAQDRRARLIYDREKEQAVSEWVQDHSFQTQSKLHELVHAMTVTIPSAGGGSSRSTMFAMSGPEFGAAAERGMGGGGAAAGWNGVWATAVDLTNLTQAAQGNPVLLSYFGAIRERIQQAADGRAWQPVGHPAPGVAYVGFIINRDGTLRSADIVSDRSTAPPQLCGVALQIVENAGPFPAFPPSFEESSKAIVVPIEFAFGPS